MFRSLLLFLFTLSVNFSISQDVIYVKDGTTISAKILAVGIQTIEYKKANFLEGPLYTLSKDDIDSIAYSNGSTDFFQTTLKQHSKLSLKDTIIYSTSDTSVVDTVIISRIKFYVFKHNGSSLNQHDLIADFTNHPESKLLGYKIIVNFHFERSARDFNMRANSEDSKVAIPFRFVSSGSLRRYLKIIDNHLLSIIFVGYSVNIEFSPEQTEAFSKMLYFYYKASLHKSFQ